MEELLEYIDIRNIITQYVIFKPKSKVQLKDAVNYWCEKEEESLEEALNEYGHISNWNTSFIICMRFLFNGKKDFNDNINNWDVSKVEDMGSMFNGAESFNKNNALWYNFE